MLPFKYAGCGDPARAVRHPAERLSRAERRARALEYGCLLLSQDRLLRRRDSRRHVKLLVEIATRLATLRAILGIAEHDRGGAA